MKILKTATITFCVLIFLSTDGWAQDKNEISLHGEFLQLKEKFNQGVVYNGSAIGFRYGRNWFWGNWELRYRPKMVLGAAFNRGMTAVQINFVPVDFSGVLSVYKNKRHHVKAGLNFATNYNYQIYPEQHNSARLFWFGEIGIAPCLEYSYQWKQRQIKAFAQNSLLGFVSRTESIGHYFYSFKFADFFTQPHSNMKFGSFDKYNHTNIVVEYTPNISNKHSFALGLEYIDSYYSHRFQSLNYYLQWKKSF